MAMNPRGVWAGALGLALGLTGGWLLPGGGTAPRTEAGGSAAEVAALTDALARAQHETTALAAEVATLRATLARTEAAEAPEASPPDDSALETESASEEATDVAARPDEAQAFDDAALEILAFSEGEIRRLRERHEALELERLYLRDQARREGWLHRPRYQSELRALRQEAIDELGEREYDAMLYAAGRNNRVIVTRRFANSAAEAAGIRAGDALLSYDGLRIFDASTIVQATAAGQPGASTELRIERGGEEIRLFVPRGPLGVQLRQGRRPPDGP
jgi:hypothetical protein